MEIEKPEVLNTTADSITLLWNYAFNTYSNFNAYEIYWAKPGIDKWQLMERTDSIKYTVKNLGENGDTRFKVRAVTSCGLGPFSPEVLIKVFKEPEQMEQVAITVEGCDVIVSWITPIDSDSIFA